MTQIEAARKGIITRQMTEVAEDEGLVAEDIRALVATGEVVIPHNHHHEFRAIGQKRAAPAPRPEGRDRRQRQEGAASGMMGPLQERL